jgi:transposase
MEMFLEIRPWRLLYALLGPWSYENITRDTTMASFVRLKRFLVFWKKNEISEILLQVAVDLGID